MPSGVLVTTSPNRSGNSSTVTRLATSTRVTGTRIRLARKHQQTAPRPISHTRYCGLITRLVTVNISTATKAASAAVCAANREAAGRRAAASRHSSSQPNATALSPSETVPTVPTCGPRNSIEP